MITFYGDDMTVEKIQSDTKNDIHELRFVFKDKDERADIGLNNEQLLKLHYEIKRRLEYIGLLPVINKTAPEV